MDAFERKRTYVPSRIRPISNEIYGERGVVRLQVVMPKQEEAGWAELGAGGQAGWDGFGNKLCTTLAPNLIPANYLAPCSALWRMEGLV